MADVVMAMPSLLKPYFQWHCHWMPILPLASEQWEAFLDAPVPFLTGVPRGHTVTESEYTGRARHPHTCTTFFCFSGQTACKQHEAGRCSDGARGVSHFGVASSWRPGLMGGIRPRSSA